MANRAIIGLLTNQMGYGQDGLQIWYHAAGIDSSDQPIDLGGGNQALDSYILATHTDTWPSIQAKIQNDLQNISVPTINNFLFIPNQGIL